MALEMSSYKVYKKTFLTSVRWLFAYSAKEDGFIEHFIHEMELLSYEEGSTEARAVMMKKRGITVLANAQIIFINCATDVYMGFEEMRQELQGILVVLDKLGIKEIKTSTCVKENVYKLDKAKVKTNLTEAQFAEVLFKDGFVSNPLYVDSREDIQIIVSRSFTDSLTEAKMQLLVSAYFTKELQLSVLSEKLPEIDKASYDAWSSVVSDGVKRIMEG